MSVHTGWHRSTGHEQQRGVPVSVHLAADDAAVAAAGKRWAGEPSIRVHAVAAVLAAVPAVVLAAATGGAVGAESKAAFLRRVLRAHAAVADEADTEADWSRSVVLGVDADVAVLLLFIEDARLRGSRREDADEDVIDTKTRRMPVP
uniref:Uncharacterized protein n=1 Tax=Leersia perrieri TaxID=77586 RepID=A0A0D9XFN1_9ORYZ